MIHQLGRGIKAKLVKNSGVLKATSRNVTKQFKMRQERNATTWAEKVAEAAAKQLVNKEIQTEKAQIEEWKQTVMTKVVYELQGIKMLIKKQWGYKNRAFSLNLRR